MILLLTKFAGYFYSIVDRFSHYFFEPLFACNMQQILAQKQIDTWDDIRVSWWEEYVEHGNLR